MKSYLKYFIEMTPHFSSHARQGNHYYVCDNQSEIMFFFSPGIAAFVLFLWFSTTSVLSKDWSQGRGYGRG